MSAGAADDDELLSVADIIDEALAIIAATDEAPSPDDECTGQGQATALRAEARERRAGASRGSSGSGLASASHRARPTCRAPSTLGSRGQEHALRAAGAHVLLPRPRHDGRHADAGRGARAHNGAVERPQVAGRPRAAAELHHLGECALRPQERPGGRIPAGPQQAVPGAQERGAAAAVEEPARERSGVGPRRVFR